MLGGYREELGGFTYHLYGDYSGIEYLVLGLPDVGLVGAITGLHLIRELKMKDVVGIDSYTSMPPVVVIHNSEPMYPMRIYRQGNLGVLLTDVPVAPPAIPGLATSLVRFAKMTGVKMLISVTGMGTPKRIEAEKPGMYALAVGREAEIDAGRIGASKVDNGILVGPYALILKEAARTGVNNLVLMVESFVDLPDPEAAAVAVEAVSKITGVQVDTKKLVEEAEKLKLRLKELMRETKNVMAKMGKSYEYRPPLIYT
ncbi:MAG: PAC2 family protein [Desulfurococcales archaeon]|nr:PAC2 family protein [Desulfurococcales archaeon]